MIIDRSTLLRPATAILDLDIERSLQASKWFSRNWFDDENSSKDFFTQALSWLEKFLGENNLKEFSKHNLTSGTTGAFQDFYQINQGRHLKVLRGEYPFHRDVFSSLQFEWSWLVVDELAAEDFVILSVPFSGDGEIHPELMPILNRCEQLQIPVLIDCAFAGLSNLVLPKMDHFSCIKKVCFSLSKVFNLGSLRCGFEFSRYENGANFTLSQWDYGPKAAAFIGLQLMKQFPLEFMHQKYRDAQLAVCQELKVRPSSTVLFGIGDESWKEYSRDGYANRICLSEVLSKN